MAPASVLEVASEKHSLPAPDRKTRNLRTDGKLRRFGVSTGEGNTTGNLWLVNTWWTAAMSGLSCTQKPTATHALSSEALGVDFVFLVEGGLGRFLHRDSATGEWLNTLGAERSVTQAEATARQMGVSAKRWHKRNRSANYDRRHGRRQNAISTRRGTRASPTRGEFATADRSQSGRTPRGD